MILVRVLLRFDRRFSPHLPGADVVLDVFNAHDVGRFSEGIFLRFSGFCGEYGSDFRKNEVLCRLERGVTPEMVIEHLSNVLDDLNAVDGLLFHIFIISYTDALCQ